MIIQHPYTIDFFDVDHRTRMTFKAMARAFQGLATRHSQQVGAGYTVLNKQGVVWFLHRLKIEVIAFPRLFDQVRLFTWSRGFKGFKGFREYRIESAGGDVLVRASSVWLFYNFIRKRITKVPKEISDRYRFETRKNFDTELDDWKPRSKIDLERELAISLRYSDFDMNGHVNNTEYIGFLESLFYTKTIPGLGLKSVKIRFEREIGQTVDRVCTGWQQQGNHCHCEIFDDSTRFARAQLALTDLTGNGRDRSTDIKD